MPDTIGSSEHHNEANVDTERAAERQSGPNQMPPVPEEIEGSNEDALTEPHNAKELEEARNPLGYNATEATREEMDAAGR
jgi:hypothetical protein